MHIIFNPHFTHNKNEAQKVKKLKNFSLNSFCLTARGWGREGGGGGVREGAGGRGEK